MVDLERRVLSGAGAAGASGVSFQAQLGASLVVAALNKELAPLSSREVISSISFETGCEVDDINLMTVSGRIIYIQAKATINYSCSIGSDFSGVIRQFLRQRFLRSQPNESYVLAIGSRSSRKLIDLVGKVLNTARTTDFDGFTTSQSQAHISCLKELIDLVLTISTQLHNELSSTEALSFLRDVSVQYVPLDEDDGDATQSILFKLQVMGAADPFQLWGKICSDCAQYSKNRQSLKSGAIHEIYGRFLTSIPVTKSTIPVAGVKSIPVGKDYFLCRIPEIEFSSALKPGLALMELYRFDGCGMPAYAFGDDNTLLLGGVTPVEILLRASSESALCLMLPQAVSQLPAGSEYTYYRANSDDGHCEISLWAQQHRQRLARSLSSSRETMRCLNCRESVSTDGALLIEIICDEPEVGPCHKNCLRPLDRILGSLDSQLFREHPELINFDYKAWIELLPIGQKGLWATRHLFERDVVSLGWRNDSFRFREGKYVIVADTAEGGSCAVLRRGRPERVTHDVAHNLLSDIKRGQKIMEELGREHMLNPKTGEIADTRSLTLGFRNMNDFIKITNYRIAHYRPSMEINGVFGGWYSPMVYLRCTQSGTPVAFHGIVPLLSNPLKLSEFISLWQQVGFHLGSYDLHMLKSDDDFDRFVQSTLDVGQEIVVDPKFIFNDTASRIGVRSQTLSLAAGGRIRSRDHEEMNRDVHKAPASTFLRIFMTFFAFPAKFSRKRR